MVDPIFVLKALEDGFDGILIAGCHIGDCHYISGNVKAEKRVSRLKQLLHTLGIEDARLRLEWISAAEGEKFARTATEFVSELKVLGASPLKKEPKA
jgi:F420-non-reducing hydrogenase iron-sulfur subunit